MTLRIFCLTNFILFPKQFFLYFLSWIFLSSDWIWFCYQFCSVWSICNCFLYLWKFSFDLL